MDEKEQIQYEHRLTEVENRSKSNTHRLDKLENKDGEKWDKFKWLIVAGLVTLILGYLAVTLGLK